VRDVGESELRARVKSWLSVLDESSYYELLGILEIAGDEAIQAAFHEFSLSFHPDNHRGAPAELRADVTRIFKRGAEAYRVLRDANSRAAYDRALAQGALRLTAPTQGPQADTSESLESCCLTPGGRLHARQAERALRERKLDEAHHLYRKAVLAEGINLELEERFRSLFDLARRLV
jgi:DnaJ-class molecular chaperone